MIMESPTAHLKIPRTIHPVLPAITARWSPRSFSPRVITDGEMATLAEAATWAPSSTNEQPWILRYARKGTPAFDAWFDCLVPGNRFWAGNASILLASIARRTFNANGNPNRHAMYDLGAANALLLVQGASMGIYGHQMGGFDMGKAIETLQLQEDQELSCFIALGFLDEPDKLEEPFRTRELTPRTRRPVADILQEG